MDENELIRLQKEEIDMLRIRMGEIIEPVMDACEKLHRAVDSYFSKPIHPIVLQVDDIAQAAVFGKRDAQAEVDAETNIEACKDKMQKKIMHQEIEEYLKGK